MKHSHKFNQNLYGYLTFAVLFMFISQTTAKNECQKDPIKTGQELLDSAPTLFNGIKSESFGGEMVIKWLQKYAFGVLCCQKIEPKFEMNENFKNLQNNFCQQLKTGKSMEEAAVNVESAALKVMQNLDKPKILQNIRQKIAKNSFLDGKIREKMAQLLGHFQIGMDKFYGIIKDRLNVAHSRDEADHRSNGGNALRQHQRENALRQHQRRRRKRMRSFEVMMSDAIRRTSTPAAEFQPTRYGTKGCIVLFVITVCTVGAAIFIGLRLSGTDNNHTSIIAILAILIFAFLFEFVMLMWYCVMEHDDH